MMPKCYVVTWCNVVKTSIVNGPDACTRGSIAKSPCGVELIVIYSRERYAILHDCRRERRAILCCWLECIHAAALSRSHDPYDCRYSAVSAAAASSWMTSVTNGSTASSPNETNAHDAYPSVSSRILAFSPSTGGSNRSDGPWSGDSKAKSEGPASPASTMLAAGVKAARKHPVVPAPLLLATYNRHLSGSPRSTKSGEDSSPGTANARRAAAAAEAHVPSRYAPTPDPFSPALASRSPGATAGSHKPAKQPAAGASAAGTAQLQAAQGSAAATSTIGELPSLRQRPWMPPGASNLRPLGNAPKATSSGRTVSAGKTASGASPNRATAARDAQPTTPTSQARENEAQSSAHDTNHAGDSAALDKAFASCAVQTTPGSASRPAAAAAGSHATTAAGVQTTPMWDSSGQGPAGDLPRGTTTTMDCQTSPTSNLPPPGESHNVGASTSGGAGGGAGLADAQRLPGQSINCLTDEERSASGAGIPTGAAAVTAGCHSEDLAGPQGGSNSLRQQPAGGQAGGNAGGGADEDWILPEGVDFDRLLQLAESIMSVAERARRRSSCGPDDGASAAAAAGPSADTFHLPKTPLNLLKHLIKVRGPVAVYTGALDSAMICASR